MITAVDTNVIVALWDADEAGHLPALDMLNDAAKRGGLVICGAVFGELLAGRGRTEKFLNDFLQDSEIFVDWSSNRDVWRSAGLAFQKYAARRRRQRLGDARRILTDFYIGAHADVNEHALLTLDTRIYRVAFPKLKLTAI